MVRERISELIIVCLQVLQRTQLLSLMMRPEAMHTCGGRSRAAGSEHCWAIWLLLCMG